MRRILAPVLLLGVLYLCFFGYLGFSASQLPERVATHFAASGQPNDWMSRSAHLAVIAVFGIVFPLFVVGLSYIGRYLPDQFQNIPRRGYWLAPQRREETFAYLFYQSLWFACLAVCFAIGIQFSVVQANSQAQAHLSGPLILGLAGGFLAGTTVWAVNMFRHFSRDT